MSNVAWSWVRHFEKVPAATQSLFSVRLFISVSFSDAQISNLYLLEHNEVGRRREKNKQEFSSHLEATSEFNCAWRSGGRKIFSAQGKCLEFTFNTASAVPPKKNNLPHWGRDEILPLWFEKEKKGAALRLWWWKQMKSWNKCHDPQMCRNWDNPNTIWTLLKNSCIILPLLMKTELLTL